MMSKKIAILPEISYCETQPMWEHGNLAIEVMMWVVLMQDYYVDDSQAKYWKHVEMLIPWFAGKSNIHMYCGIYNT